MGGDCRERERERERERDAPLFAVRVLVHERDVGSDVSSFALMVVVRSWAQQVWR